jgi:hypothetical protein
VKTRHYFRAGGLAVLATLVFATASPAAVQLYLKHGAWVCATPEAYDSALQAQRTLNGRPFEELRKELYEKGQCVYIEDDEITSIQAPYLTLLETHDKMMHVSFVIKYEKRLEFLKRELNWFKFSGWTEADNLKELW